VQKNNKKRFRMAAEYRGPLAIFKHGIFNGIQTPARQPAWLQGRYQKQIRSHYCNAQKIGINPYVTM
jgi:hypothetical protein